MKSDFKEGRRGLAFKNGKLYSFEPRHVLVMTAWPDPRAWFKRRSHGWKATRKWADELLSPRLFAAEAETPKNSATPVEPEALPSGQYMLPGVCEAVQPWYIEMERRNRAILSGLFDTIPQDVRAELLKYSTRKWHLLNIFARCPGSIDLSQSNPALLYALASNWVFHKPCVQRPVRAARSLVNKKQKQILSWIGFPATEPVRRILCKIAPRSLSVGALLYLRSSLMDDPFVLKTLSHLGRINAGVLRLVTDARYRQYITPRLLEDIGQDEVQDDPRPPIFSIFLDTLRMAEAVEWRHQPRSFVSLPRLMSVHDDLAGRIRPDMMATDRDLPARFADPPYAGTETIRPLTTPDELYLEGREMGNCVASYAGRVADGNEYIYRVMSPVRATLSVHNCGGRWTAGEMTAIRNAPVSEDARTYVYGMLFESGAPVREVPDPVMPVDHRQLPLLSAEDLQIFRRCAEIFEAE